MLFHPTNDTQCRHHDNLVARAYRARDLALQRLAECRAAAGNWPQPIELNGTLSCTVIVMLRTTGMIDRGDWALQECRLARRFSHYANPDGGFYKFRGSPSSRAVTDVTCLVLRLVLGEVAPGRRTASWFRRNEHLTPRDESNLRELLKRGEAFLASKAPAAIAQFEFDQVFPAHLLAALTDLTRSMPWAPLLHPGVLARCLRSAGVAKLARSIFRPTRLLWPAFSILRARHRDDAMRARAGKGFPGATGERTWPGASIQQLADHISQTQGQSGGWMFSSGFTAWNVMALIAAGRSLDNPAIVRAEKHLRDSIRDAGNAAFSAVFDSDLGNTGYALESYLRVAGHHLTDEEIAPTVDFLLQSECEGGGYGWDSGYADHPDADSSVHVLRALAVARYTANGNLRRRLDAALQRGAAFVLTRQSRDGGFCCWDRTFLGGRSRVPPLPLQILFDLPTSDVTARAVEVFAGMGLGQENRVVRRAVRFLLRNQCPDGSWWSRWWAGYLAGTCFPLRAFAQLGLRWNESRAAGGPLSSAMHRALRRGVEFLVRHQNPDGGWGETIRADEDWRYAGVGPSTPLHTAYVLSALLRCGYPCEGAVRRGIEFLLSEMTPNGRWTDQQVTFTIYAPTFYYSYPFLNYVLPLDALTDFLEASSTERPGDANLTADARSSQRPTSRALVDA